MSKDDAIKKTAAKIMDVVGGEDQLSALAFAALPDMKQPGCLCFQIAGAEYDEKIDEFANKVASEYMEKFDKFCGEAADYAAGAILAAIITKAAEAFGRRYGFDGVPWESEEAVMAMCSGSFTIVSKAQTRLKAAHLRAKKQAEA